jgi:hypothetical protein
MGQSRWVTGYYPTWWYGAVAPSAFEMGSLTHLIIFAAQDASTSTPFFTPGNTDDGTGGNMQQLITLAHAKGVKVIMSVIGGYGQTGIPVVAANAQNCQTFVTTACAWAKARNFDGVEIDWEFPRSTDGVGWNRLIRLFRIELDKWSPKGILMTSINYVGPSSPPYYKDSMMVFDQINHMSYTMWMGPTQEGPYKSGFDTPVNMPTQFSGYSGTSLSSGGPAAWVAAGYPASKIGIGIPFESSIFSGVTTMGQSYSSWQFGSVATQSCGSGYPSVPASGRQYDATAQAAWCVNGGKVYAYQDTNSVKAIVAWAKNNNYGGIMVWDFPAGHDNAATPKDNLLRVVARETFAGSVVTPTPVITVSPQSLSFGSVMTGTTSAEQSYTLSASTLTPASGNITVTAPTGFQVSKTSGSGFSSSLTVAYTGSALSATSVYVRFSPTAAQSYSGNVSNAGGGASIQNVALSGNGVSVAGTLTALPQTLPVGGGYITLTWTSQNATSASIDQGVGSVALNGSTSVSVTSTTTFTLTLSNSTSSVQYSASVEVAGSQTAAPEEVIYHDTELTESWTDVRSWSVTCDYNSTSQVYEGTTAVQIIHSPWASLQFSKGTWNAFTSIDPAGYESLTFAIHGGSAGVTLQITCVDNSNAAQKTAVSITAPANAWSIKTIPMSQLAIAPFTAIAFTAGSADATFSLDELDLVKKAATGVEKELPTPKNFVLDQNYPNPFNPSTVINYQISTTSRVTLKVCDMLGKEVATLVDGIIGAGYYNATFNGSRLASGIYFARMTAEPQTRKAQDNKSVVLMKKMILVK